VAADDGQQDGHRDIHGPSLRSHRLLKKSL
jgi:hypothetical protein